MRHICFGLAAAVAQLIAFAPASAQQACDRADLQKVVDRYLVAQATGVPLEIPFADFANYTEQGELASMSNGMLSTAVKVDFHRSLLDTQTCTTFTEAVVSAPAQQYVIGARLQFAGRFNPIAANRVSEVELVITDKDDWLFDAEKMLKYSKAENWTEIPAGKRDSRATLIAAASAYLSLASGQKADVPWGVPCARLDGGMYAASGEGAGAGRCDVAVPAGPKSSGRRYVVDETIGAVAVLPPLDDKNPPAVQIFRVESGKIRYIHSLAVCRGGTCGLGGSGGTRPAQN